jgi:hypothetical protein
MAEQGGPSGPQSPFADWMRGFGQPFPNEGPGRGDHVDGVDSRPTHPAPDSRGNVIDVEGRPAERDDEPADEKAT